MNPHLESFYSELERAKGRGLLDHHTKLVMHYNSTRAFYEAYDDNEPVPVKYAVEIQIRLKNSPTHETHQAISSYLQNKYQITFVHVKDILIAQLEATKEELQRLPSNISRFITMGNR